MKVFIERTKEKKDLRFSGTVSSLLKKLKINPVAVIVTRKDEVLTQDQHISDNDRVKILSVISGG
ncbi:MoaD/ThiS family protein [Candidatus Woesearchaeota archaeon]|nr:MoaD/ThiS family protein [Candidatus Woesearchaeota archaeon]